MSANVASAISQCTFSIMHIQHRQSQHINTFFGLCHIDSRESLHPSASATAAVPEKRRPLRYLDTLPHSKMAAAPIMETGDGTVPQETRTPPSAPALVVPEKWQPSRSSELHDDVNIFLLSLLGFGAIYAMIMHGMTQLSCCFLLAFPMETFPSLIGWTTNCSRLTQ